MPKDDASTNDVLAMDIGSLLGAHSGLPQPNDELLFAVTEIVANSRHRQFPHLSAEDEAIRWLQQSREELNWKCPAELASDSSSTRDFIKLAKIEFSYERPLVRVIELEVHDGGSVA